MLHIIKHTWEKLSLSIIKNEKEEDSRDVLNFYHGCF